jgi:hypothetical protein
MSQDQSEGGVMALGAGLAIGILVSALMQCLHTHEIRMTTARTITRGNSPNLYWALISFQCFAVAFLVIFAFFPWQR